MEIAVTWIWEPLFTAGSSAEAPAPARGDTDEALMLRYRDGDDAAFRSLYLRYRAPLMRFSRHLTGRASEAEDIFQETWIAVIDARARYAVRARFITWLFAIAHRRAADSARRRARNPVLHGTGNVLIVETHPDCTDHEPPDIALADERARALSAAIATLPFAQREVFLLRAETGLGVREIATITRARPEATKSRLRYALRHLNKAMSAWT